MRQPVHTHECFIELLMYLLICVFLLTYLVCECPGAPCTVPKPRRLARCLGAPCKVPRIPTGAAPPGGAHNKTPLTVYPHVRT